MPYVLAVEPDEGQAGLLRDAVRFRAKMRVKVVDSVVAATVAIAEEIPQLVLTTALLPPRDENTLLARLRGLPYDSSPQVLIIPKLAAREIEPKQTLLGRFRRTSEPAGCDPLAFAEQLLVYLGKAGRPSKNALKRDRRGGIRTDRLEWASATVNGYVVELVDLSMTGAQILAPAVLSPGSLVALHLSSDEQTVLCEARVVWGGIEMVGTAKDPWYRAGVRFTAAYQQAIERFCSREERMRIA